MRRNQLLDSLATAPTFAVTAPDLIANKVYRETGEQTLLRGVPMLTIIIHGIRSISLSPNAVVFSS